MHGFTSAGSRLWRRLSVLGALVMVVLGGETRVFAQAGVVIPSVVAIDVLGPPPTPFRAVAIVRRNDGQKEIVRQIYLGDGGPPSNPGMVEMVPWGDTRLRALRFSEVMDPGEYSVVVRALGYKDTRPKTLKVPSKNPLQFDRLEPLKSSLVISGGVTKPQLFRAVMNWNKQTLAWEASSQFESQPLPLVLTPEANGTFNVPLAPGTYKVDVQAMTTALPLSKEIIVGNERTVLDFPRSELERKASLTLTGVEPRPGERFQIRATEGSYSAEIVPGVPHSLPRGGKYEVYWFASPTTPPVPVSRPTVEGELQWPLDARRFNKAAVVVTSPGRLTLEFFEDGRQITPFTDSRGDTTYFWLPPNKTLKWRARHESGAYSAHETIEPMPVFTFDRVLTLPAEDEFTTGKVAVKVEGREEGKILELMVQFSVGGVVQKEKDAVLTQAMQDVAAPVGAVEVRAIATLPDGRKRAQKVAKPLTVSAVAALSPSEVSIDATQFFRGSLKVTTAGFASPPVITAQRAIGGGQKVTLNGETAVAEGEWRVTIAADGKEITKVLPVTFERDGVWQVAADSLKQGALALYSTSDDRSKFTLRRAAGGGEPVAIPAFTDVRSELVSLTAVYRAQFGKVDNGAVQDGLEEGTWILSAFNRDIRFEIKGGEPQALVLTDDPAKDASIRPATRPAKILPDPSRVGGDPGATKTGAGKDDGKKAGANDAMANKAATEPWSPGQPVKIEVAGRTVNLNWVPSINGWMATTTVPNEANLPQAYSYAEARKLIEELNAAEKYRALRDDYVFALPKLQEWQRAAGTRSRDQIAAAVGRGSLARVDAGADASGFAHFYGNVWQWVQPDRDEKGNERLRVVGGSFITKLEDMPANGVSFIRTDLRRETVGLRIALVKP